MSVLWIASHLFFNCLGFYGIAVVVSVSAIQVYTAILLGKCWSLAEEIQPTIQNKNRYPYSAVTELAYGKHLSRFVTILLDVTVFAGGIPNLIVGKFFEYFFQYLSDIYSNFSCTEFAISRPSTVWQCI